MDRDKLVSIAGMFGSSHDGERAAAALKADLLLKEEGLNWEAVLTPAYAAERCDLALELIVRGWPAKAAAGIAACLNVPEEGTAPNLAGWRDGRWNQFLDWSSAHGGRDPTDVGVQLDFLSHNLRGVFSGLAAKLNAASTVKEASALFKPYVSEETKQEELPTKGEAA